MITDNSKLSVDKQIYSGTSTGRSDIVMDIFLMKISYICLFSYIAFRHSCSIRIQDQEAWGDGESFRP